MKLKRLLWWVTLILAIVPTAFGRLARIGNLDYLLTTVIYEAT